MKLVRGSGASLFREGAAFFIGRFPNSRNRSAGLFGGYFHRKIFFFFLTANVGANDWSKRTCKRIHPRTFLLYL